MRLAVPGDDIATSQYLPEKNTNEYRIPSIHNVQYAPRPEIMDDEEEQIPAQAPGQYPNIPAQNQKAKKKAPTDRDPFYRC